MTKTEILEIVKQMKTDFVYSQKIGIVELIVQLNTGNGFCVYLNELFKSDYDKYLVLKKQLMMDCIHCYEFFTSIYWYPVFDFDLTYSKLEVKNIMNPRIDHLQRTITRLENEIKNEN